MKKKFLAMILVLCMALSMVPATVSAATAAGKMTPSAVGELTPVPVLPNAKSYAVTVTGSGKGEARLMVDSPARVGSEVYFLANPDDGYLAEIYYEGLDDDDLVYMGADIVGFIMPSNRVTIDVRFVEAQGSEHSIEVWENGGVGSYSLTRHWAKEYESILLAVEPSYSDRFDPLGHVWVSGADTFYLFEDNGIHYYEIIMGSRNVNIFLCYEKIGPFSITPWLDGVSGGGTVQLSHEKAYVNDLVTVTIKPNVGFKLVSAKAVSYAGDLSFNLEPIGNDQYTFRMHPAGVELHVVFAVDERNVTVAAGPNGTAYANVTRAQVGSRVTLTCVPDRAYDVDKITGVEGITDLGGNVYQFTMPARNVSINVTFKKVIHPVRVTVENGLGGTAHAGVEEARVGDTVTVTCVPEEGYRVARVAGAEGIRDNGDGTYSFLMPGKAVDIQVLFLREDNPFLDVNETHFFYDPVQWAVEKGITSGISSTKFGPFDTCNRAQVVTFLWRYAGSPEPAGTENSFTDVAKGSFYEKPVLWAVENGITNGVSSTKFGPDQSCNRAQVVTFLWRLMEQPVPGKTEHPFTDVDEGSFYEQPVLWAVENGITTGASSTTFNPNGMCQRAQVVTFLYRTAQLQK